jgi:hypothetical protein
VDHSLDHVSVMKQPVERGARQQQIIRSIGETNGAIAPKSIEVKFAEAKRFGDSGSVHQSEIDHCNAEMSKLVNGSTLTNDNKGSGGASYALGSVHDGGCWEAVQYDAERLKTAFERDVSSAARRRSSRSRWCASDESSRHVTRGAPEAPLAERVPQRGTSDGRSARSVTPRGHV